MFNWLKSKLLFAVVLLSIALLAAGTGSVVSGRHRMESRQRMQVESWRDWQQSLSDDLPRGLQRDWRQMVQQSPEAMMKACSFEVDPVGPASR